MSAPRRAWVSWSSGKDSAYALRAARAEGLPVEGLLTTVDAASARVPVHGVAHALVAAQAEALGLPLHTVALPWPCPDAVYRDRVRSALVAAGVDRVVFGDLFLADVRAFREELLAGSGVTPVFPLWGRDTAELAAEMVGSGLRAVVAAVDLAQAPARLAGRHLDRELLDGLPASVDPCGERGEFHTFVEDGPGFARPVEVVVDGVEEEGGFAVARLRR